MLFLVRVSSTMTKVDEASQFHDGGSVTGDPLWL